MTVVQRMRILAPMVLGVTHLARAQESAATPPHRSTPPAVEEKQRTEEETRKRLQQLACGPSGVHFSQHTDKGPQVLPEQPPEKGLIYVIRSKSWFGAAVQAKLAMDGKWMGVNRQSNYFHFEVDPGPHYFCLKAGAGPGTVALLSLVIEKGKTYYLHQNLTYGGMELDLLDDEKGKQYVAEYHRSFFEEKPKK